MASRWEGNDGGEAAGGGGGDSTELVAWDGSIAALGTNHSPRAAAQPCRGRIHSLFSILLHLPKSAERANILLLG